MPVYPFATVIVGVLVLLAAVVVAMAIGTITFFVSRHINRRRGTRARGRTLLVALPVTLIAFILVGLGLFSWFLADQSAPQGEPREEDIVGEWIPTTESLEKMRREGYPISTHSVVFEEDGNFTMTNIPVGWTPCGGILASEIRSFCSGYGMWMLEKGRLSGRWEIFAVFTSISGLETKHNVGTSFYLSGEHPPYYIVFIIGDPDSGESVVFERK